MVVVYFETETISAALDSIHSQPFGQAQPSSDSPVVLLCGPPLLSPSLGYLPRLSIPPPPTRRSH